MRGKIYLIILFIMALGVACRKSPMITFSGKPSVYFTLAHNQAGVNSIATDSVDINFGFAYPSANDSVFKVGISVTGVSLAKKRMVRIAPTSASTAKSGIHYEPLPETVELAASRLSDTFLVKLLRAPDLKDEAVMLELELLPSDDFNTDLEKRKIVRDGEITYMPYTKLRIFLYDMISEGGYWNGDAYGKFSAKKLFIISELTGCNPAMFSVDALYNQAQASAAEVLLPRYLASEKAAGRTVFYEDGTEMRTDDYY